MPPSRFPAVLSRARAFAFAAPAALCLWACDHGGGEPAASSLEVKGLSLVRIDTLQGKVHLSWNRVRADGLLGYAVFRDPAGSLELSREPINARRLSDTLYVDTLPSEDGLEATVRSYEYRVRAMDREGGFGPAGSHLVVDAPSPGWVRTRIALSLLGARDGAASIGDTVRVVADYRNLTRANARLSWLVDDAPAGRQLAGLGRAGSDTFAVAFRDPSHPAVAVRIVDEAGTAWTSSIGLDILRDAPEAQAGEDRAVALGDSVVLQGQARDGFGRIVKWEWDAGATGDFREAPSGRLAVRASGRPGADLRCVLRVTDDDGNTALDELIVKSRPTRPLARMAKPRRSPQGGFVAGKLYVLGGSDPVVAPWMEAYDPSGNVWTEATTLPSGRSGFQARVAGGRIYVVGGKAGATSHASLVEAYDPATGAWKTCAPLPEKHAGFTVAVMADTLVLLKETWSGPHRIWKAARYLPGEDRWETSGPTDGTGLGRFAVRGDRVYTAGGQPGWPGILIYEHQIDGDRRQSSTPLDRRVSGVFAMVDSLLFLVGRDGATDKAFAWGMGNGAEVDTWEPASNRWAQKDALWTARVDPGAFAWGGKLYVVGGAHPDSGVELSDMEVYLPY